MEIYLYYDGEVMTWDTPTGDPKRRYRYKSSNLGTTDDPKFVTLTNPADIIPPNHTLKVEIKVV